MTTVKITNFRDNISTLANHVQYQGEHVCVERNGKPAFGLVTVEEMKVLEKLSLLIDLEDAENALASGKFIDWEEAKKRLDG